MPHPTVKDHKRQWRWGNIVRPTKKELVQVVYGIWVKNGKKGKFKDFWETGKS